MPVFFTHHEPIILMKNEITFFSHYHYEAELIYVVEGAYRVISKGVTYDLKAGDVWLGFPFEEHSYENVGDNLTMLAIFTPESIEPVGKLLRTRRPGRPMINLSELSPGLGDELCRIAQMWMAIIKREWKVRKCDRYEKLDDRYIGFPSTRENVLMYLAAAIGELLLAMDLSPRESTGVSSIERVIGYCFENMSDSELSMAKLSAAVGLSRSQISRLMSGMMNTSFPEFLHSLRIDRARRLLKRTDNSVTDIAFECGFMSQRNFNRVFREFAGMTPSEYRAISSNSDDPNSF